MTSQNATVTAIRDPRISLSVHPSMHTDDTGHVPVVKALCLTGPLGRRCQFEAIRADEEEALIVGAIHLLEAHATEVQHEQITAELEKWVALFDGQMPARLVAQLIRERLGTAREHLPYSDSLQHAA